MEPKRIPHLGAGAGSGMEKRKHNMPRKGISKVVGVKFVEDISWNEGGIERERHGWSSRAAELGID